MNQQFSVYLNLIRFVAAIVVFLSHVKIFTKGIWQIAGLGHEAVVVFFVLSGFVISFVTFGKKEDGRTYVVNRLSRIYSVAIPAILLTLFLYYLGHWINAEAFIRLDQKLIDPFLTTLAAVFFVNQSWIGVPIFSNLPYWSLGYEVLYYVFFGILVFTQGIKRNVLLLIILLIMGPSVILYLPIWFMGVVCYKMVKKYNLTLSTAVALYIISIIGMGACSLAFFQDIINSFLMSILGDAFYGLLLDPAERFGPDYLLGVFVSLHIFSSFYIGQHFDIFSEKWTRRINDISSHTFSLYLYHMPLLFFVSAVAPYEEYPISSMVTCWIGVPVISIMLSHYTEKKKGNYRVFFGKIFRLKTT